MDPKDIGMAVARTAAVYLFVLAVIRFLGKREVGNFGAFDFLVALMIGEVVDEIIYGDVTLVMGLSVISAIAALEYLNSWASFKSKWIERLTAGQPTVIVKNGTIDRKALAHERLNQEELESQMRLEGIEDLSEIKKATVEPSGAISFIERS